jgi:hypothetical protein
MLFEVDYFLPYLMSHTLHDKTPFSYQCAILELRYLNSKNIVHPELFRSQTFQVNDLLLYT